MRTFRCDICGGAFPVSLEHEHHKVPKSLGGSDDPSNISQLDHGCHNNLHLLAYMMINPKRRHEIDPTLMAIFPQNAMARKNLMEFAYTVAKEMALKKEIKREARDEVRTVVELPAKYMELLKLAGYDNPHSNGRPAGVSKTIRTLVAEALAKKFPTQREIVLDLLKKSK